MINTSLTGITRNVYEKIDELKESLGTNDQTFKIEFYNYDAMKSRNLGWTKVGLITFNKDDIKEYKEGNDFYIDREIKPQSFFGFGPLTHEADGSEISKDLMLIISKSGDFILYQKINGKLSILSSSVRLVRTTQELLTSPFKKGGLKYRNKSRRTGRRSGFRHGAIAKNQSKNSG
jgi:hypothetical protein